VARASRTRSPCGIQAHQGPARAADESSSWWFTAAPDWTAGDKSRVVAVIGHRNGDTHPDLVVTGGDAAPSGRVRAGYAYVIAG